MILTQQEEIEELTRIIEEHKIDEVRKTNDLNNAEKEMEQLVSHLERLETEKNYTP